MTDQKTDRSTLPIRRPPFRGLADQTLAGSQPDWDLIGHVQPPEGAPNVLDLASSLQREGRPWVLKR